MSADHVTITVDGMPRRIDPGRAVDCGMTLRFDGPGPRVFSADPATAIPMAAGEFVGSIVAGGPVDVMVLRLNPHCNGTHTESAAHVSAAGPTVARVLPIGPVPASLVTAETVGAGAVPDETGPHAHPEDRVVPAAEIDRIVGSLHPGFRKGLLLRTRPKAAPDRDYDAEPAPYLTAAAAGRLVGHGVEHLVVEWPSIDRLVDGGLLAAHRAFWRIREGLVGRPSATVTELADVPDSAADGPCIMILHAPAFDLDVAPSRPVIFPLTAAGHVE